MVDADDGMEWDRGYDSSLTVELMRYESRQEVILESVVNLTDIRMSE